MKVIVMVIALFAANLQLVNAEEFDGQMLIGTWGNSNDGGVTFWGFDKYFQDGRLVSWGTPPGTDIKFEIISEYGIEERGEDYYSCLVVTAISHPHIMPVGSSWCDKIIKISNSKLIFENSEGEVVTLYKQ